MQYCFVPSFVFNKMVLNLNDIHIGTQKKIGLAGIGYDGYLTRLIDKHMYVVEMSSYPCGVIVQLNIYTTNQCTEEKVSKQAKKPPKAFSTPTYRTSRRHR